MYAKEIGSVGEFFELKPDTSYCVRTVVLYVPPNDSLAPKIVLVEEGVKSKPQKDGSTYQCPPCWKFPGGGFKASKDKTLLDTGYREYMEETGMVLEDGAISPDLSSAFEKEPKRNGSDFHIIVFFLVITDKKLDMKNLMEIQDFDVRRVGLFPLDKLIPLSLDDKSNRNKQESSDLIEVHGAHLKKLYLILTKLSDKIKEKKGIDPRRILYWLGDVGSAIAQKHD